MPTRSEHWEGVYRTRRATDVSWFQTEPAFSLALVGEYAPDHATSIIDIGGGVSLLAASLLRKGYVDLSVLDISAEALARAQENLGTEGAKVDWIVADITIWQPPRRWSVWHDRAVFHFLTDVGSQDAYIRALHDATGSGAIAIISGFAPDGPEKCSGLPIVRYDAKSLSDRIGSGFKLLAEKREAHETPAGAVQNFYYAVLHKR